MPIFESTLEGRDTANQYKALLSNRLHPMITQFHPDGSGLF